MDPFTIALATFGVQKLRGKSTKRALRDAALIRWWSLRIRAAGQWRMQHLAGAPYQGMLGKLATGPASSGNYQDY